MTRPAETTSARWDDIDREKVPWIIPAERMKKGRVHVVPFTKNVIKYWFCMPLSQVTRP